MGRGRETSSDINLESHQAFQSSQLSHCLVIGPLERNTFQMTLQEQLMFLKKKNTGLHICVSSLFMRRSLLKYLFRSFAQFFSWVDFLLSFSIYEDSICLKPW
jgi:hypothetical protein